MAESTKGNKSFVGGIPRISTLEEQIERVVAKYQGIRQPCAIIHDLLSNKGDHSLLIDVVTQQLMLIKSRSQAWEDGHVTVWDKALVILSKNGTDVGNLSVLELYVEEFIGVNPNSRGRYAGDTVAQHISVKSLQGERELYLVSFWVTNRCLLTIFVVSYTVSPSGNRSSAPQNSTTTISL